MSETPQTPAPQADSEIAQILAFFDAEHLPEDLKAVSLHFRDLAHKMADRFQGPMLKSGLYQLLGAKDAMVRAAVSARPAAGKS